MIENVKYRVLGVMSGTSLDGVDLAICTFTKANKWAFEILYELGIEIDSSIFPANRSHGGLPSFKSKYPSIISYNGVSLKEFPINYHSIFNKKIIYSGGGYFRFIPYTAIKKWSKCSDYIMSYFHPRDFDFNQPIIKELSTFRKFKSYVGRTQKVIWV